MGFIKKIKIYHIIISFLLLILIVTTAHYIYTKQHQIIEYNNILDPIAILSLLATAILTIWIGSLVVKRMSEQRFIKEFIINDIKKVEDELEHFEDLLFHSEIENNLLFNKITMLNNKIQLLNYSLKIINTNKQNIDTISDSFLNLYSISTETNEATTNLQVKSTEISALILKIKKELRIIIFAINNL